MSTRRQVGPQFLPTITSHLLSLDGHKSTIGWEWLELCQQNNCEAVRAPANTSHFLQPRNQFVNKAFKGAVRGMRDEMTSMAIANAKSVQFKLISGVFVFHRISTQDIRKSFQVTCLASVKWEFSKRFTNINDRINQSSHLSNLALAQKHLFGNSECPHASNGQTHC